MTHGQIQDKARQGDQPGPGANRMQGTLVYIGQMIAITAETCSTLEATSADISINYTSSMNYLYPTKVAVQVSKEYARYSSQDDAAKLCCVVILEDHVLQTDQQNIYLCYVICYLVMLTDHCSDAPTTTC